ncbi:hypothetical protein IJG79_03210 [Candidatus Saccharibacteria bacterium]|nr:hypothetical protein [Candidatus Saccharibacteria bacterium]
MNVISDFGRSSEIRKYEISRSFFQKERERGITELLNYEDKSYKTRFTPADISESVGRDIRKIMEKRQEYAKEISKSLAMIIALLAYSIVMTILACILFPSIILMAIVITIGIANVNICYNLFVIKSVERYRKTIGLWYYYLGEDEGIKSEIMDWEPSKELP